MRVIRILTMALLGTIIGLIYRRPETPMVAGSGHATGASADWGQPPEAGGAHWGRYPETAEPGTDTGTATWPQADNTITEKSTTFTPDTLEVRLGETVTFLNRDDAPHAVRINDEDLTWQAPGESVQWKADTPGVYSYICNIHPEMTGQVVVK